MALKIDNMKESIEYLIESFNTGWTQGDFEVVELALHENVVFLAPDLTTEIIGKEACIETIKEYLNNAKTLLFEVEKQKINVWHKTANVSIDYYIEYLMNSEKYKEKGKEFWTLNKEKNHWKIVWRAMVNNENIK